MAQILIRHDRQDMGSSQFVDGVNERISCQLIKLVGDDPPIAIIRGGRAGLRGIDQGSHDDVAQLAHLTKRYPVDEVADDQLAGVQPLRQA